jgi:hypothetical protein
MTDVLERVARDVAPFLLHRKEARDAVRAAILALREPSEGMVKAGMKHLVMVDMAAAPQYREQYARQDVTDCWQAMLDHLLEETKR